LSLVIASFWISTNVLGLSNLVEIARRDLNDGKLANLGARRLYIYSEADKLIGWKDVESHAEEAKRKGVQVEMVKVDGSAHVQHMGKQGESWEFYWKKVRETWITSSGTSV